MKSVKFEVEIMEIARKLLINVRCCAIISSVLFLTLQRPIHGLTTHYLEANETETKSRMGGALIDVGSDVKFDCDSHNNVTWLYNGNVLDDYRDNVVVKGNILTINNANIKDSGLYDCYWEMPSNQIRHQLKAVVVVKNKAENNEKGAKIQKRKASNKPEFAEVLHRQQDFQLGGNITLSCPATGNPKPVIIWAHNGQVLNSTRVVLKDWSLHIRDAILEDDGLYDCYLLNPLGMIYFRYKVNVNDYNLKEYLAIWGKLVRTRAILILLVFIALVCILVRLCFRKPRGGRLDVLSSHPSSDSNNYEVPIFMNWELPRQMLKIDSPLGEGSFAYVLKAKLKGFLPNGKSATVAVKVFKKNDPDGLREIEIMKLVGKHANVINFVGCCTQEEPIWAIMEYAPHGNLKDFLKQICRDSIATEQELMVFGVQIARGMHFLESKKCIHGDLAARNVLVGDNFIMKIADFGFSRYVKGTNGFPINPNNKLPIRWMSIETLEGKDYDSSCDVWSFGVVLWEILTLGEEPYLHTATTNLYNFLNMGNRLEKPPLCSNEMYVMMRQCWNSVPKQRPTFGELVRDLEYMCNNQGGNINAALQNEY